MSYQVPDDTPHLSQGRLLLFNSFCFLSFIIIGIVGYYFVLIDLFSHPAHEWINFLSQEMTRDYERKAMIPLIPCIPCSWICIYHEYRYIEYSKRAPSGVWYGICGLLLLLSFLIYLRGIFAAY